MAQKNGFFDLINHDQSPFNFMNIIDHKNKKLSDDQKSY